MLLTEWGAIASIFVAVILILVYLHVLKFPKEGFESNPVVGAAVGNAANRAQMRSDGYGADVSGLAQASEDATDPSTRAGVVLGLSTLSMPAKQGFATHKLGFQGVMAEPPVFWNQGNLDEVAEYENAERMNMPSQGDLMQNNLDASLASQNLMQQSARQAQAQAAQAAKQGFRIASAY